LEALPIPISIVDRKGIVRFVNRVFLEFAQCTRKEITYEDRVDHYVSEFFDEPREFWESAFRQVLAERPPKGGVSSKS